MLDSFEAKDLVPELDKIFDTLKKENSKVGENIVAKAIDLWNNFKKKKEIKDAIDNGTFGKKEFLEFCDEYKKYYKDNVSKQLSENYETERSLLCEVFGYFYTESDDSSSDDEILDDEEDDGSDKEDSKKESKEDTIHYIYIIPIPN